MSEFFYLKKLIGGLLMPIPLTLIVLILSLILFKARPIAARVLLLSSILLLAATSFMPIADSLMQPLEDNYEAFDIHKHSVDVVVVLGSCHETDLSLPPAGQLCGDALSRLVEGIRILNANPNATLFLSGYKLYDERPHAQVMYEAALSLGIPQNRIRLFKYTQDTEAEAKAMAPSLTGKTTALVTSASHLPRAMRFFMHQGIQPVPAPSNKIPSSGFKGVSARAQAKSERAFYEYLGQAFQWLKSTLDLI